MKNLRISLLAFALSANLFVARADEGMWLPMLVKKSAEDMAKKGFKLSPDDIYSINKSSIKDAIVQLGNNGQGFCTAEIVSDKALLFTNHHCAFSAIQSHSTVEHNYLDNGFWAKKFEEELPVTGLTASILVRMEDVTKTVLDGVTESTPFEERKKKVKEATKLLQDKNSEGGAYKAIVKEMFNGNEYYMYVYEIFTDVRLVGAPPSSIGKFGGDTDNWMWPRHTGDFSVLRIYAGKDNKPAAYSTSNVPYKPKHSLPVSIKGYKDGDFNMVFGFPGTTDRYITSQGMHTKLEKINPALIAVFGTMLDSWKKNMDANKKVDIQYAAKYAQRANSWKYFIGQNEGLYKMNVIPEMEKREAEFMKWVNSTPENKARYGEVLPTINKLVKENEDINREAVYLSIAGLGTELSQLAMGFSQLQTVLSAKPVDENTKNATVAAIKGQAAGFYKNYDEATDREAFIRLLTLFQKDIPVELQPQEIKDIQKAKGKTTEEKTRAFVEKMFSKTFLTSPEKLNAFLDKPDAGKIEKDPVVMYTHGIMTFLQTRIMPVTGKLNAQLEELKQKYVAGLMASQPSRNFYPDANSSLRFTYGTVMAYRPKDAVDFHYMTTTDGIIEKYDPKVEEFHAPQYLLDLIKKKDFGRYAENGKMPVAFIANTDITGGNSGSPMINGNGELTGIAFDGNWEAMSGDLVFDAKYKRTIGVDIRYVLFVIDKFAGAQNLINELKIAN